MLSEKIQEENNVVKTFKLADLIILSLKIKKSINITKAKPILQKFYQ